MLTLDRKLDLSTPPAYVNGNDERVGHYQLGSSCLQREWDGMGIEADVHKEDFRFCAPAYHLVGPLGRGRGGLCMAKQSTEHCHHCTKASSQHPTGQSGRPLYSAYATLGVVQFSYQRHDDLTIDDGAWYVHWMMAWLLLTLMSHQPSLQCGYLFP